MDYTLQVHEAKYIYPIPDGLKELSSDIIREVLRHQPEHINGFIADYLDTMLIVREKARDAATVVTDVFREGYFYDELYKLKNITREEANTYATIIQAGWRGYVVRKKIAEWMKKKKKFEEEKQRRRSLRIEELLAGLGITYDEATRAAGVIQMAYKESKRGKWVSSEFGEIWIGERVPLMQRIREDDTVLGRFARWEKEDFGDFFEMDQEGGIKYVWPRIGQLRKVLHEEVPDEADLIEFYAMRDLQGQEQYSYLIRPKIDTETRGKPIGFLIPMPKSAVTESSPEVEFIRPENICKMGHYTYIFRNDVTREDLEKFEDLLKTQAKTPMNVEIPGEFDYDPHWVLPRVLIRIKPEFLSEEDDEVKFLCLSTVVCEDESYSFRAETLEQTARIIRHILRDKCLTVEEGLKEAGNRAPYKIQETGRIFPVDDFTDPNFIQKIIILPESATGAEDSTDTIRYAYVFLPLNHPQRKKQLSEAPLEIPVSRFQGYHSDYKGSADLQGRVFVLGPKLSTPDGKPFTFESLFWDEFGVEAWYQLLYNISLQLEEPGEEEAEEEQELEITEEEEARAPTEAAEEEEFMDEKVSIKAEPSQIDKQRQKSREKSVESERVLKPEGDGDKKSPKAVASPTETAEPGESTERTEPTEPAEPAEPAKPEEPAEPVKSEEPVEPSKVEPKQEENTGGE